MANVKKTIFGVSYATICVTSVKLLSKQADSAVNNEKKFYNINKAANVLNYFWHMLLFV